MTLLYQPPASRNRYARAPSSAAYQRQRRSLARHYHIGIFSHFQIDILHPGTDTLCARLRRISAQAKVNTIAEWNAILYSRRRHIVSLERLNVECISCHGHDVSVVANDTTPDSRCVGTACGIAQLEIITKDHAASLQEADPFDEVVYRHAIPTGMNTALR